MHGKFRNFFKNHILLCYKINSNIILSFYFRKYYATILSLYFRDLRYCVILISMFKFSSFCINRGVFPLIMNNTNQIFTRLNPNQIPLYHFLQGISTVRFSWTEKLYRYFIVDLNRPKSIQTKTKSKQNQSNQTKSETKPN